MFMRLRSLFVVLLATSLAGCRALGDEGQSFFGDDCTSQITFYGCVDIRGTVTTSTGAPLEGVDVGPATGTDTHGLGVTFVDTGPDGKYELRLFQLDPNAPATFQLSLKATQRNNAGTEIKSRIVTVQVAPSEIDEIPDAVVVDFVIQ
jgi:hypothetical protein